MVEERGHLIHKKGQVAMEFLMTYGWAIIIILLAIAALWLLGVFSPSVTTTCQIEAPFTCQDAVVSDNSVIIRMGANQVQTATVNSITVNGQNCPQLTNKQLVANQISTVRCTGLTLEEDEKVTVQIGATYEKEGGGLTHTIEGAISGQASSGSYVYSSDSALVAAYDFETDAIDVTANGHDGTITAADCKASGKVGTGCAFDGATSYIQIPDDASLNFGSGDFSLEAWIKLTDYTSGFAFGVLGKQVSGNDRYYLDYRGDLTDSVQGSIADGANNIDINSANNAITDNNWHHVVLTVDQTNDIAKVFVDGIQSGSDTGISSIGSVSPATDLFIGATTSTSNLFDGSIDEVAIWSRVLTTEEILAHATF